jgi:hypothetical protein
MDNFEAARQALRDTPFYREACQTEHVMSDWPAMGNQRPSVRDNIKIRNAYRRMDFLIRHSLAVDFNQTVMSPRHVSALDDFIRFINDTMPMMGPITPENGLALRSRLYMGKEMLGISHAECAYYGLRQAVGSRWFENFVIQHGFTMEEIVYLNPFNLLYGSYGNYIGIASTEQKLLGFHSKIRHFWQ